MCRRFTGPHSVLQIFLENIIECIEKISQDIKMSAKDLQLWNEEKNTVKSNKPMNSYPQVLNRTPLITTTSNSN